MLAAARQKIYATALVSKTLFFYLIIVATVGMLAAASQTRYVTALISKNWVFSRQM